MALPPRAVVVHRRTELQELLDRHGTRGQVEFFLRGRGLRLTDVQRRHDALRSALQTVRGAVPEDWRRADVERSDLARFAFAPEDVVVAVGQDGLVANVAKYLDGQPVIGVDPEPGTNPGVLVPHRPGACRALLPLVPTGRAVVRELTMVRAVTDDHQELRALNEIFVGAPGHQSARYTVTAPGGAERQSSSGVLVGTGTGATGWCRSLWQERRSELVLPRPDEAALSWFTREAWPSPSTGTAVTEGRLDGAQQLSMRVESDALVAFGDGMEADRLTLTWGQSIAVGLAPRGLRQVVCGAGAA